MTDYKNKISPLAVEAIREIIDEEIEKRDLVTKTYVKSAVIKVVEKLSSYESRIANGERLIDQTWTKVQELKTKTNKGLRMISEFIIPKNRPSAFKALPPPAVPKPLHITIVEKNVNKKRIPQLFLLKALESGPLTKKLCKVKAVKLAEGTLNKRQIHMAVVGSLKAVVVNPMMQMKGDLLCITDAGRARLKKVES